MVCLELLFICGYSVYLTVKLLLNLCAFISELHLIFLKLFLEVFYHLIFQLYFKLMLFSKVFYI